MEQEDFPVTVQITAQGMVQICIVFWYVIIMKGGLIILSQNSYPLGKFHLPVGSMMY